jgi:hypothetical protein
VSEEILQKRESWIQTNKTKGNTKQLDEEKKTGLFFSSRCGKFFQLKEFENRLFSPLLFENFQHHVHQKGDISIPQIRQIYDIVWTLLKRRGLSNTNIFVFENVENFFWNVLFFHFVSSQISKTHWTGWSSPRVHIDEKVWHLDRGDLF